MDFRGISEELMPKIDIERILTEMQHIIVVENNQELYDILRQLDNPTDMLQIILEHFESVNQTYDFINLLLICDHIEAARIFAHKLPQHIEEQAIIDSITYDPQNPHILGFNFDNNIEFTIYPEKEPDAQTTAYELEGDDRGYFYILVNFFSMGTIKQMLLLGNIFHKLKFNVILRKNMNREQIYRELLELSNDSKLNEHCAFVMYYLGHGNSNVIEGFDSNILGNQINLRDILELFKNCPQLQRKSKNFIFDCCRGENQLGNNDPAPFVKIPLPRMRDFLICYSTLDGIKAMVDRNYGTTFGRNLAEQIIHNVRYKDFSTILSKTNDAVLTELEETYPETYDRFDQPIEWTQNSRRRLFLFLNIE